MFCTCTSAYILALEWNLAVKSYASCRCSGAFIPIAWIFNSSHVYAGCWWETSLWYFHCIWSYRYKPKGHTSTPFFFWLKLLRAVVLRCNYCFRNLGPYLLLIFYQDFSGCVKLDTSRNYVFIAVRLCIIVWRYNLGFNFL